MDKLSKKNFTKLVELAPIISIDLVVMNEKQQILVGKRKNEPAKGTWFIPGGRVYKNEKLEKAFLRISESELGIRIEYNDAILVGLYDHFYNRSMYDESITTHYISATHCIVLEKNNLLNLPKDQHQDYRWICLEAFESDISVHKLSKLFLENLTKMILN